MLLPTAHVLWSIQTAPTRPVFPLIVPIGRFFALGHLLVFPSSSFYPLPVDRVRRPTQPRTLPAPPAAENGHDRAPCRGFKQRYATVWLTLSLGLSKHMPFRQEIQFLRDRARRLREMADTHQTALSDQFRVMVAELESVADELDRKQGRPPPSE